MHQKNQNPAAVGAACRVGFIEGFGSACDAPEFIPTQGMCQAARFLVRRFPLTEQRARLLAELSGLGGRR